MGKSAKSLMVVAIVTIVALTFAWFAGANSVELFGYPAMYLCGWIALIVNWLAFLPAAAAQSDKFYDSTGALTYITVTAVACYAAISANGSLDMRALVVAAMVVIWCIRLGSFLFLRIHAMGGTDSRFEKIKVNPARFLVAWTLQALWVILTASAAVAIITSSTQVPLDVWFWIGAAGWVFGFAFEAVADAQKSAFKEDPANSGKFINVGLWRWCRCTSFWGPR